MQRKFKRARMRGDHLRQSVALACARGLWPALAIMLAGGNAFGFDAALEPTVTTSRPSELWLFLPAGYLLSVAIETPVLLAGLPRQLSFRQRFCAGLWLTACTYPIVVLVLPVLFASSPRSRYLLVAETFAPVAECALFWLAFHRKLDARTQTKVRSFAVIIVANLLSFLGGELLNATRWFGLF
ncbi:MAG TPA: hypothetical protein VF525_14110 [Pyrinomonadaceae bacterium]|jgi:hypothetical protein